MGGEAMFWRARAELSGQEEILINQFQIQVEKIYQALLERLEHHQIEVTAAAQEYQQIRQKDYFKVLRQVLYFGNDFWHSERIRNEMVSMGKRWC